MFEKRARTQTPIWVTMPTWTFLLVRGAQNSTKRVGSRPRLTRQDEDFTTSLTQGFGEGRRPGRTPNLMCVSATTILTPPVRTCPPRRLRRRLPLWRTVEHSWWIPESTAGSTGNVWLRVESAEGQSQFDGPLATANLVDASRLLGIWSAETSPQYGHGCEDCVFWNTRGSGTIRTDQFGWGYVIGTTPEIQVWRSDDAPLDWLEGEGRGGDLVPSSLYEDQRRRRLGLD